jgi:hypothetical protein
VHGFSRLQIIFSIFNPIVYFITKFHNANKYSNSNINGKSLFPPGSRGESPGIYAVVKVVGKEKVIKRINAFLQKH